MSILSGLNLSAVKTDKGVEFSFEEIKLGLMDGCIELSQELSSFDAYNHAYDVVSKLCLSIEEYDGCLDTAVRAFVDGNGELSEALGLSLEEDKEDNGEQVKEAAKKGVIAKIWQAIKNFFCAIGRAIRNFFSWIGRGFKSNEASWSMW